MDIICKPFEWDELRNLLEDHQDLTDFLKNLKVKDGVSEEEEVTVVDKEFTRVKIDQFYSSKAVLFDIFINISKNKYLKILHAGR